MQRDLYAAERSKAEDRTVVKNRVIWAAREAT